MHKILPASPRPRPHPQHPAPEAGALPSAQCWKLLRTRVSLLDQVVLPEDRGSVLIFSASRLSRKEGRLPDPGPSRRAAAFGGSLPMPETPGEFS